MRRALRAMLPALCLFAAASHRGTVGDAAAPFTLRTFSGTEVMLADLRGEVVVLNYWATWCGPCRAELPAMDAYVRAHPARGLRIFAVATEDSVPPYQLKPLAAALSFPLVKSFRSAGYGIIGNGVPTSYVIDRRGILRYAKAGAFDAASFDALITPLLAEPAPPPAPAAVTARAGPPPLDI